MRRFGASGNNTRFALLLIILGGAVLLSNALKAEEIKDQKFVVKTLSPLSASTNQKGDVFTLEVLEPEQFKGNMIEGEVLKAKASGKVKGKSELAFKFRSLVLRDRQIPIDADLVAVSNSKGVQDVDEEGHVIGKSSKKRDVATTAVATGIGALIGGLAGGGSGAAKGAAVGAAIGLTIAFSTKGEDIQFAPGSLFELRVTSQPEGKEAKK